MGPSHYRELGPARLPVALRGLVECAWRAEVPVDGPVHSQRVLPDGCMDLLRIGDEIVVAGPDTTAHVAAQAPGSAVTGLRFRPGHLPALLGVPAYALRDERVALDELVHLPRQPARDAGVHLGAAAPPGLTALLATAAALQRAAERDRRPLPGPLPGAALRALATGMPAAELADRFGVTTRTLHRRSLATLGYGPSVARRVLRFRTAAALLHAGTAPAEAAVRAGYADQPHLSREVRALAGVSPAALAPAPQEPAVR